MKLHILDKYIYMAIAGILLSMYGYYKYIQHDRVVLQEQLNNAKVTNEVIKSDVITEVSNTENLVKFIRTKEELSEVFDGNMSDLSDEIDIF